MKKKNAKVIKLKPKKSRISIKKALAIVLLVMIAASVIPLLVSEARASYKNYKMGTALYTAPTCFIDNENKRVATIILLVTDTGYIGEACVIKTKNCIRFRETSFRMANESLAVGFTQVMCNTVLP